MSQQNEDNEISDGDVERFKLNSAKADRAAFIVLAGAPALTYFLYSNYSLQIIYFVFLAISVGLSICSFFIGAKGLRLSSNKCDPQGYFNKQAIAVVSAYLFLIISAYIGFVSDEKPSSSNVRDNNIQSIALIAT